MKKQQGIAACIIGAVVSTLGILGAACTICAPLCGGALLSGLLVSLLGVSLATFFHQHSIPIAIIGAILFLAGVGLLIRSLVLKKRCCAHKPGETEHEQRADVG